MKTNMCLNTYSYNSISDPHNATDEYLRGLHWPLYNFHDQAYLEIDINLTAKTGNIHEERFRVWDELFPFPSF